MPHLQHLNKEHTNVVCVDGNLFIYFKFSVSDWCIPTNNLNRASLEIQAFSDGSHFSRLIRSNTFSLRSDLHLWPAQGIIYPAHMSVCLSSLSGRGTMRLHLQPLDISLTLHSGCDVTTSIQMHVEVLGWWNGLGGGGGGDTDTLTLVNQQVTPLTVDVTGQKRLHGCSD